MAKTAPVVNEAPEQAMPESGGSYMRNPETGELELESCTLPFAPAPASDEIPFTE